MYFLATLGYSILSFLFLFSMILLAQTLGLSDFNLYMLYFVRYLASTFFYIKIIGKDDTKKNIAGGMFIVFFVILMLILVTGGDFSIMELVRQFGWLPIFMVLMQYLIYGINRKNKTH